MTKWDKELQKADKFMQRALEHGDRVYERYQDKRDDMNNPSSVKRANLFYSGVQTLRESLFNSLPKADVSRMHKDASDDVARVASLISHLNEEMADPIGFALANHAVAQQQYTGKPVKD
jgi:hypothetical protein